LFQAAASRLGKKSSRPLDRKSLASFASDKREMRLPGTKFQNFIVKSP